VYKKTLLAFGKLIGNYSVVWNSLIGSPFRVYCGVRQGGVLSTLLFAIYVDTNNNNNNKSSPRNSTHYAMLYPPTNGDRMVAVYFVTSFHPMYINNTIREKLISRIDIAQFLNSFISLPLLLKDRF